MDLALSPEQQEVRTLVREFAEREVKPRAEAIDHNSEFPRDLVDKAAHLGLLGVLVRKPDGSSRLVNHIQHGEIVGEMALLSDEPRSATIYATRESDLLFFGKGNSRPS